MSDLLDKIGSKYIMLNILEYTKYDIKLKLFFHSKKYINKFDLMFFYHYNYLKAIGLNLFDYFELNNYGKINKEELKNKFNEDFQNSNANFNISPEFLTNFYNEFTKNNSLDQFNVDIYSPMFEILSKTDLIQKFTINISIDNIQINDLYNDYISIFKNLNESKSKYSSILFTCENINDIDYLNKLNINFSQIKELYITNTKYSGIERVMEGNTIKTFNFPKKKEERKTEDYSFNLLKSFLFFNDIKNNLITLEIHLQDNIEVEEIKLINDLKVLENLELYHFKLREIFLLELKCLKTLKLNYCEKISFENCCLNLINLMLEGCIIVEPKSLLKLPNLVELNLVYHSESNYNLLIDFKSLNKLEKITAPGKCFMNLENTNLKIAKCNFREINNKLANEILHKLLTIKSLQYLFLKSINFNFNEMSKIDGCISSLIYLSIENNKNDDFVFDNLQTKFPNLSSLCIKNCNFNDNIMNLEIKENKNSKINDLLLDFNFGSNKKTNVFCQSYENLKYFGIRCNQISNIKEVLPIFNAKCDITFNELNTFYFQCEEYETDFDVIKNIYNNIDKMPNIRNFVITCFCQTINEKFYEQFIGKILSLNLDNAIIKIRLSSMRLDFPASKYSIKELNEMKKKYPKFKSLNFNKIIIYKLKN